MTIKQTSAVDRVYKWWYMEKYRGFPSKHVNLCPYLRAVLLWAPLRFLFLSKFIWLRVPMLGIGIGVIESVGWATAIYLMGSYGLHDVIPFLPGMFIVLWLIGHILGSLLAFAWAASTYDLDERFARSAPARFIDEVTELVGVKARAAHESICPVLEREG